MTLGDRILLCLAVLVIVGPALAELLAERRRRRDRDQGRG